MTNNYFCTYFNINYLPHGRSLCESLLKFMPEAKILIMCMDDESYDFLKEINYPRVVLAKYSEMETQDPRLLDAKQNRSLVEYFYTCSSATSLFAMNNLRDAQTITYLDADLYFFANPAPIFNELKNASVGIIAHRFSKFTARNKIYGIFNVGWITFKRDAEGIKCLTDWNNDCINWCYQRIEGDKYADQKYLDKWRAKYKNVKIIENKGANLALWNINNYKLSKRDGQIYVDDDQLIFYHFANLKQITKTLFKTDLSRVFYRTSGIIKDDIYMPYIKNLLKNQEQDYIVKAKEEIHAKGMKMKIINLARRIREAFYKDFIEI